MSIDSQFEHDYLLENGFETGIPSRALMNIERQAIFSEVRTALETDRLDLPALPDMVVKVGDLLDDPNSAPGQFADVLATDGSIARYIIMVANSAAISNGRGVDNLHDAIPRLGYRMLYSMVMNITLTKLFQANNPLIKRELKEMWENDRNVAANCYVLAQNHKHLSPEKGILAGLVHDIGALPLYLYADRQHPEIDPATLAGLIRKFSAPVGVKLLRSWNFPEELVAVVANKRDLRRITYSGVADYVDVVTMANLQIQGMAKAVAWKNVFAAERLGYYAGDCKNFLANHAEQFAAVNDMLGIDLALAA